MSIALAGWSWCRADQTAAFAGQVVFRAPMRDELRPIVEGLGHGSRLFVVEGGDHSLSLPKSRGESLDDTLARVADEVVAFIAPR